MSGPDEMKNAHLTLGPVLFNWPADIWRDFYFKIADEAPVETVYLGETVCLKRMPFIEPHLAEVTERLEASGKNVIHSTLALVMTKQERRALAAVAKDNPVMVEANDVSALTYLSGKPHALGPYINVYNEETLTVLASRGARRVCLPPELPLKSIEAIAQQAHGLGVAVECFAYGRIPLALSARCYHARIHDRSKDGCLFVCEQDPDGLTVATLDDENFLAVNGIQTLSFACQNLVGELAAMTRAGVGRFRLSPHSCDMTTIARAFRAVLDGGMSAAEAVNAMKDQSFGAPFANGFIHGAKGVDWVAP